MAMHTHIEDAYLGKKEPRYVKWMSVVTTLLLLVFLGVTKKTMEISPQGRMNLIAWEPSMAEKLLDYENQVYLMAEELRDFQKTHCFKANRTTLPCMASQDLDIYLKELRGDLSQLEAFGEAVYIKMHPSVERKLTYAQGLLASLTGQE